MQVFNAGFPVSIFSAFYKDRSDLDLSSQSIFLYELQIEMIYLVIVHEEEIKLPTFWVYTPVGLSLFRRWEKKSDVKLRDVMMNNNSLHEPGKQAYILSLVRFM